METKWPHTGTPAGEAGSIFSLSHQPKNENTAAACLVWCHGYSGYCDPQTSQILCCLTVTTQRIRQAELLSVVFALFLRQLARRSRCIKPITR